MNDDNSLLRNLEKLGSGKTQDLTCRNPRGKPKPVGKTLQNAQVTRTRSSSGKAASRHHRFPGKQDGRNAASGARGAAGTCEPPSPRPGASTPSVPHLRHPALPLPGVPRNGRRSGPPRCRGVSGSGADKPTPATGPQS